MSDSIRRYKVFIHPLHDLPREARNNILRKVAYDTPADFVTFEQAHRYSIKTAKYLKEMMTIKYPHQNTYQYAFKVVITEYDKKMNLLDRISVLI